MIRGVMCYLIPEPHIILYYVNTLNVPIRKMAKRSVISTTLGEEVEVDKVYEGCTILIGGYELRVDLVPLDMFDFDIILGMDWLSVYHVKMDCYNKVVILLMPNEDEVIFRGETRCIMG
jgi:hypothetical protein